MGDVVERTPLGDLEGEVRRITMAEPQPCYLMNENISLEQSIMLNRYFYLYLIDYSDAGRRVIMLAGVYKNESFEDVDLDAGEGVEGIEGEETAEGVLLNEALTEEEVEQLATLFHLEDVQHEGRLRKRIPFVYHRVLEHYRREQ